MKILRRLITFTLGLASMSSACAQSYTRCDFDNQFSALCVGTLVSTSFQIENDPFGFFLGRRPTYTEASALTGDGGREISLGSSPAWVRQSVVWATQGSAVATDLSYPAPLGGDPLLAQATAGALLSRGSLGVSSSNLGLVHSPSNGYNTRSQARARLGDVISVTVPAFSSGVTITLGMGVSGYVSETGPAVWPAPYATAELTLFASVEDRSIDGSFAADSSSFFARGSSFERLQIVSTIGRPGWVPANLPLTVDFFFTGTLLTGFANFQYPYDIDFGRTAYFDLEVPDGASWSSYSGVFLSQPVPEPAAIYMALLGLLVVVSFSRTVRSRKINVNS
jgi:hypothetical protein